MNSMEIINKIKDMLEENNSQTMSAVYKKAFDEVDLVKLFQLRSLLLKQIDIALENTSKSKHIKTAFYEISLAIAYPNMNEKISAIATKFTSAHISNLEQAFDKSNFHQDYEEVEEIFKLNDELKDIIGTENISFKQKKIILEICHNVDIARFEHKIAGNNAIKKLHEIVLGKLLLYRNDIEAINNTKVKEKLFSLYTKIVESNKKMNTFISIVNKVDLAIDYMQKFIS